MELPGGVTLSSGLPLSTKAASSVWNTSDHSQASVNADVERSFFRIQLPQSPKEKPSLAQSPSEYPKAAANGDGDHFFFRTRAQHSSETGTSSLGSAPTSPISPLTSFIQRKTKKTERQSLIRSETAFTKDAYSKASSSTPNLQPANPEVAGKEVPKAKQSKTSQTSRSSYSSSSTVSGGAQKSSKTTFLRIPSNATKDGQPPREAKSSYRWKNEISGHWLEIRLGRKRRPDGGHSVSEVSPGVRSITSPSPLDSGNETLLGHRSPSSGSTLSKNGTVASQEGLYCRTRRRLGLKKDPLGIAHVAPTSRSVTGELLEEASDALRDFAEGRKLQGETASIATTNMSIAGNRSGLSRLFPSHRRNAHSASSSVRNLLMGKPPQPTPDPEAMYQGSDANTYFRTDLTDPDGPTFLPSEARKIGTPPVGHANRGFFFNTNKRPEEDNSSPESAAGSTAGSTPGGTHRKRRGSDFDWYRVKEVADEAKDEQADFELNIPEHLPNSPMCPRNPKHKSGGQGVCVYHGRNKESALGGKIEPRR